MPNIVKGFFNVKERCYYLFTSAELSITVCDRQKRWSVVGLAVLKPEWYLLRKLVSSKTLFSDPFEKFHDGTK